jgi:16S rRNA (guanine966-N2)-methyltransferase
MRITTGRFKGRTVQTVGDLSVRPAMDRARQTIFNILAARMELEGISVLDLFAGSGSLGLEALSRGASRALFVESSREACRLLQATLERFGCADEADVITMDARQFLAGSRERFHLVFADPPYVYPHTAGMPDEIIAGKHLAPGGILLIEHATGLEFPPSDRWELFTGRRFGRTTLSFFRPVHNQETAPS